MAKAKCDGYVYYGDPFERCKADATYHILDTGMCWCKDHLPFEERQILRRANMIVSSDTGFDKVYSPSPR